MAKPGAEDKRRGAGPERWRGGAQDRNPAVKGRKTVFANCECTQKLLQRALQIAMHVLMEGAGGGYIHAGICSRVMLPLRQSGDAAGPAPSALRISHPGQCGVPLALKLRDSTFLRILSAALPRLAR